MTTLYMLEGDTLALHDAELSRVMALRGQRTEAADSLLKFRCMVVGMPGTNMGIIEMMEEGVARLTSQIEDIDCLIIQYKARMMQELRTLRCMPNPFKDTVGNLYTLTPADIGVVCPMAKFNQDWLDTEVGKTP